MEIDAPQNGIKTNSWDSLTKNAEGEAEIHRLHSYAYPPEEADIENLFVRKAPAQIIKSIGRRAVKKVQEQYTIVAGDAQLNFGDSTALDLLQVAIRETQPDNIVFCGDMVDLPARSRWQQRPEWVGSTQRNIDAWAEVLGRTRANAPKARIVAVEGNHEQRMVSSLERDAQELLGLRRAMGGRAVLSLAYLCNYDEMGIEVVQGYPNGTLWLEDNLKVVHGTNTQKGGSNAAKYLREENESTIYGHTHRQELAFKTHPTRDGKRVVAAASPGALCLTDGSVPGFNYSPTSENTLALKAEDWQQGLLQIYHEGEHHEIVPVRFNERGMILNGKRYGNE